MVGDGISLGEPAFCLTPRPGSRKRCWGWSPPHRDLEKGASPPCTVTRAGGGSFPVGRAELRNLANPGFSTPRSPRAQREAGIGLFLSKHWPNLSRQTPAFSCERPSRSWRSWRAWRENCNVSANSPFPVTLAGTGCPATRSGPKTVLEWHAGRGCPPMTAEKSPAALPSGTGCPERSPREKLPGPAPAAPWRMGSPLVVPEARCRVGSPYPWGRPARVQRPS